MTNPVDTNIGMSILYWDDLPVGTRFTTSTRTITESDVVNFACLTADFNRVHVDDEYAKTTSFGQRIAHGMLVASASIGLVTRTPENARMEPALLGLLENRLTFPKPTFIGDTIRVAVEVVDRQETSRSGRGVITFRRYTYTQNNDVVVDSTTVLLMQRR